MLSNRFPRPLAGMAIVAAGLAVSLAGAQTTRDSRSKTARNRLVPAADVSGAAANPSAASAANIREYRIGPGDVLAVEVWKEPDASSASVPVRLDGKVSLPMVGELSVLGLTPAELENILTVKYREFIRDAHPTVMVKEINSQKVYLIGEVKKEGPIRLQAPITVLQALAEAGGITDYAKRRKIYILRTSQNRQLILPFDYDAVVRGEKMEQNISLAAGDTIIVPR